MELHRFTTSDGVELHGALEIPQGSQHTAAIYLHGAGGNFYASSLLDAVRTPLFERGVALFAINTRGHDAVCNLRTAAGGRRGGAAFEVVDECRLDIAAAVDCLIERGFRDVQLIGHSLGALKAVYAQAVQPHPQVSRLLAISPPRLSYALFRDSPQSEAFRRFVAEAQTHVNAGQPQRLMEVAFPLPLLISAAAYLDKYGPGERYDVLRYASQLTSPAAYIFGGAEVRSANPAFRGLDEALRCAEDAAEGGRRVEVVPSADHFYSGRLGELAAAIRRVWS